MLVILLVMKKMFRMSMLIAYKRSLQIYLPLRKINLVRYPSQVLARICFIKVRLLKTSLLDAKGQATVRHLLIKCTLTTIRLAAASITGYKDYIKRAHFIGK